MASRGSFLFVWPWRSYWPPPDLNQPELRSAFELGRDLRGRPAPFDMSEIAEIAEFGPEQRVALGAGRAGAVRAPAPVPWELLRIAIGGVFEHKLRTSSKWRTVLWIVAGTPVVWWMGDFTPRLERRAARKRGLTAESAPVPRFDSGLLFGMALAVARRAADTRRPRERAYPDPVAASLVRECMRRRDFRAATRTITAQTGLQRRRESHP